MKNPSQSTLALWRGERPLAESAWAPLGWAWAVGATLHRKAYDFGILRREALSVPVISVGNLVVGGAGKTPVTLALAERFLKAGRRVAVVSRGYGRMSTTPVVIVSDGSAVRATALEAGDEPVLLAHRAPELIVVVGSSRVAAGRVAVELGADLVLLDDGFSHHALERRDDILVVDRAWGVGNGRTLPAGPLREPRRQSARASLVWLSKCKSVHDQVPEPLGSHPVIRSCYEARSLVDLELREAGSVQQLVGARVVAVCGIARPKAFEQTLSELGASVRALLDFPDHHRFTRDDADDMARVMRSERAEMVVTTEKDAVRLSGLMPADVRAVALRMDVRVVGDATALDDLVRRYAPAWEGEKRG